jgi:hypothetical protein
MIDYVVKAGDCLSSIAHRYGYTWQALWNDPANASLKALRKNPNILFPSDVVHVPEKAPKEFPATAKVWNRFRINREATTVRLRLRVGGTPLANLPFKLSLDGAAPVDGMTDAEGRVDVPVPPDARRGELRLANGFLYRLDIGGLDPLVTVTGLQARLAQLGFYLGGIDGKAGPLTHAAVSAFQLHAGLPPTGEPDARTRDALKEAFGC